MKAMHELIRILNIWAVIGTYSSLDLNFHKSSKGRGNSLGAVYICTCYFSMIYSIEKLRIFMESSCTKDSNYVYSSSVGPMAQKLKI